MINLNFQRIHFQVENVNNIRDLNDSISCLIGLCKCDFYLLCNGRKLQDNAVPSHCIIHVVPRIRGGKGGFGSMLRAIGAQIEKTTNREACRDLSGRRLRDINEEKRIKTWLSQKEEREREAEERRRKKLERLCQEPKVELIKDQAFIKQRAELTEIIHDSVEQGLKAGCSSGTKRKCEEAKAVKKKKPKGLLDDFDNSSEDDSCQSDEESLAASEGQSYKKCEMKMTMEQT